ncbi:hypothetical protein DYQ86_20415 [Acidobacteria bacterium AB60]|nr:hypothetical protein DYQ86_20415 [Acidobacteria bacterium AB60]
MQGEGVRRGRRGRRWLAIALLALAGLGIAVAVVLARAGPIVKGRVVETLGARFGSEVQLDSLAVRLDGGIAVTGGGLRIYPEDELRAAGDNEPVIAIREFAFEASLAGLFFKPTHVRQVRVRGLTIHVPPADVRRRAARKRHLGKVKMRVDEIVCDDSQLVIGTDKPDKDPRVFWLKHVVLRDLGPDAAWPYDAVLTNPVPRGEIHATGTFGPWEMEDPGKSKVEGQYLFEKADLNTIKGLGGMLRSTGSFDGRLERIGVRGKTWVPDFSLDTANHAMPLTTEFQAIVDGTSGDTVLQEIDAQLGSSRFTCRGAVVDVKGKGHQIDVTTDVPEGQIGDFLKLAVKQSPSPMTGVLELQARLQIAPGKESVSQRMTMTGSFGLREIHFTNAEIEDKVDLMSLRAQGRTDELRPGAPDVHSRMTGAFTMGKGRLTFSRLDYALPGGDVHLAGSYTLDGRRYAFEGKVRTKAEISQMVASKWKGFLLKAVDPFFKKHGWGAEIPVKVTSGKDGRPKFGFRF